MPPKKKPVKKPVKKMKQKQSVKQSVRVNVQSSGGSGGGGSSGPVPMQFRDTSGENQRLFSLVEQIARIRNPAQVAAPAPVEVPYQVPVPLEQPMKYEPQNDFETVNGVFNRPIYYDEPMKLGPESGGEDIPVRQRQPRSEAEKQRRREMDAARKFAREEELRARILRETQTPVAVEVEPRRIFYDWQNGRLGKSSLVGLHIFQKLNRAVAHCSRCICELFQFHICELAGSINMPKHASSDFFIKHRV